MTGFDIFAIALVLLVMFTLFAGVKTVAQGYNWTVERFGKYTRTLSPGLNLIVPYFDRVGRNTMIGPGLFNWDFSMLKEFPIMENHRLQFRFEAFNFPNHPNFGLPDTTLVSSSFGSISGTATRMRYRLFCAVM